MSNKVSGMVWESALPRQEKYVLLALADHCKEDGSDVYPSLWRIEWKTGYSETQLRGIMNSLRTKKILVLVHQGGKFDGDTNKYKIDLKAIPMLKEFKDWSSEKRQAERKRKNAETVPPEGMKTAPSSEGTVLGAGGYGNAQNEGSETAPKPRTIYKQKELEVGNEASSLPLPMDLPPEKPAAKTKPQDPRFPEICDAIRKCWPKGEAYKCDITAADAGAINRMLANKHDWRVEELALCIVARFLSGSVNPTESVKAWIGAITDYQSGPLDKFRVPLYTGSDLNRWRTQARVMLYGAQAEQLELPKKPSEREIQAAKEFEAMKRDSEELERLMESLDSLPAERFDELHREAMKELLEYRSRMPAPQFEKTVRLKMAMTIQKAGSA